MDIVIYTRNEAFYTSTDYDIDPELNRGGQIKVYLYGVGDVDGKYLTVEPDGTMYLEGEKVTSVERVTYENLSEEELVDDIKSRLRKIGLGESRRPRGRMLKEGIRSSERETAQKRSEADVIAKKRARELLDVLKDLKNYGYDFCLDKGRDEQALKEMNPEFGLRIRISEYDINTKTMDLCNKLSNEFRTWVYIQDWTYSKSWELTFVYECFTDGYQFNDIMKYLD